MVIKSFIYSLLVIAVGFYFVPIDNANSKDDKKDIALVSFNDSTMYTLNEETTTKIVNSKKVSRFKTKDIMYEGDFILKANDKKVENATDYISANVIIKRDANFTFLDDVKFRRNDFISLDTEELYYNENTQVAKNSVAFKGYYYKHKIDGKNLYLDMKNEIMRAKSSHFEIETTR
ncbi:hypothetical protein CP960_00175 [Malaciobacter halophilus]|uniref:LPS export ABC transporter periplasmic protein LptC n=1 Tax=Malaciobacter halophilus TaxID=197482 RepID=A0A2N1J6M8_9BACT|nr:hypothetical protein [Malaciobacter halophilus]AXH09989.1 lipooligosaccharide transport system, periplasmic component LptC [Malaciobacter halophilus]PKI82206.1 hypothetical protein CP960_00175 [Malaciobacter halophilus]